VTFEKIIGHFWAFRRPDFGDLILANFGDRLLVAEIFLSLTVLKYTTFQDRLG